MKKTAPQMSKYLINSRNSTKIMLRFTLILKLETKEMKLKELEKSTLNYSLSRCQKLRKISELFVPETRAMDSIT